MKNSPAKKPGRPITRVKETGARAPRADFWIALILFAVTLLLYAPVRQFEFVNFDDPDEEDDERYESDLPALYYRDLTRGGCAPSPGEGVES